MNVHYCAAESNACSLSGPVERRVVYPRRSRIFHGLARHGLGNEPTNQQARDGRVAVRKVDGAAAQPRLLLPSMLTAGKIGQYSFGRRIEIHAGEARIVHVPAV